MDNLLVLLCLVLNPVMDVRAFKGHWTPSADYGIETIHNIFNSLIQSIWSSCIYLN